MECQSASYAGTDESSFSYERDAMLLSIFELCDENVRLALSLAEEKEVRRAWTLRFDVVEMESSVLEDNHDRMRERAFSMYVRLLKKERGVLKQLRRRS